MNTSKICRKAGNLVNTEAGRHSAIDKFHKKIMRNTPSAYI